MMERLNERKLQYIQYVHVLKYRFQVLVLEVLKS